MAEFRMPMLGADMESGTLVEWLVKPGEQVSRGQIVAVVETQKGAVDVEIWGEGTIETLLVEPGTEVPVGVPLATFRTTSPEPEMPLPAPPTPPSASSAAAPTSPGGESSEAHAPTGGRVRISPAARRRADALGLDIATLRPSAPDGIIGLEDVEHAAASRPAAAVGKPDRQAAMRQAIAAAMTRSKREIPHYYLGTTIDLTRTLDWLTKENLDRPVTERVLVAAVLAKATALALGKIPELNGHWRNDRFEPAASVHLGMAIALRGGGLIAPAIHDVQTLTVAQVMRALSDLIARARSGALRSSELTDATVTMTSLGDQGVETVYGVIYPPQVALVGFGRVVERPWVVEGAVTVRRVILVTLSADHRASVGHRGALFLAALDRLLQQPEAL